MLSIFFVFSSRRRHTRFDCDWSSDVCSSDLHGRDDLGVGLRLVQGGEPGSGVEERGLRRELHRPELQQPGAVSSRRSEEHTSELQSQSNIVCRLLLEKTKTIRTPKRAARVIT